MNIVSKSKFKNHRFRFRNKKDKMSTPCDDKRESETDDNERLMERCWQEQYKGASRKWLIRDASTKLPQGPLCSTMKESYIYPERGNWGEENIGE